MEDKFTHISAHVRVCVCALCTKRLSVQEALPCGEFLARRALPLILLVQQTNYRAFEIQLAGSEGVCAEMVYESLHPQ